MVALRKTDGTLSKTVIFNALVGTLSAAVPLIPTLITVIPPALYPWILVGVTLVNVFLRQITSQPLAKRA